MPVVVSGTGAVSALGGDVESTWHGIVDGRSAVRHWADLAAEGHALDVACRVDDTVWGEVVPDVRVRGRALARRAAREALEDAGLLDRATLTNDAHQLTRVPDVDDRVSPATESFYIQASGGSVALPAAGYDYNSDWTPLLAGLSPAGMAASLAALARPRSAIYLLSRVGRRMCCSEGDFRLST